MIFSVVTSFCYRTKKNNKLLEGENTKLKSSNKKLRLDILRCKHRCKKKKNNNDLDID